MRFNEQYIPIHRLLGWIMGWDPQWVADPSQAGPHMTKTLSWFNGPGYQEEKKWVILVPGWNVSRSFLLRIILSEESGGLLANL